VARQRRGEVSPADYLIQIFAYLSTRLCQKRADAHPFQLKKSDLLLNTKPVLYNAKA